MKECVCLYVWVWVCKCVDIKDENEVPAMPPMGGGMGMM